MTLRTTMLAALLTAPIMVIAALIGWRGLGIVLILLMLALVAEHIKWSWPWTGSTL